MWVDGTMAGVLGPRFIYECLPLSPLPSGFIVCVCVYARGSVHRVSSLLPLF